MGSHHQFQDIQGLASQQPASADMVFWGFAGAGRRSGAAPGSVYHVMASSFWRRTIFVLVADVCANGFKRGRRRGRLGVGARVLCSPQTLHAGAAAALGEALRGAGVPTPHAELGHADVTLSPRRPRSCGQR